MANSMADLFGEEPIHTYTRAQALEDGVLVATPEEHRREAGFVYPMAFTREAWEDCVAWTDEDNERKGVGQDETGRLFDVLNMTRFAIQRAGRSASDHVTVELYRVPREGDEQQPLQAHLIAVVGPGDTPEPVITIMLPGQD